MLGQIGCTGILEQVDKDKVFDRLKNEKIFRYKSIKLL